VVNFAIAELEEFMLLGAGRGGGGAY
jgi:hypothetical protein